MAEGKKCPLRSIALLVKQWKDLSQESNKKVAGVEFIAIGGLFIIGVKCHWHRKNSLEMKN